MTFIAAQRQIYDCCYLLRIRDKYIWLENLMRIKTIHQKSTPKASDYNYK